MTTKINTNDISKTLKTLDVIIERINNNNNQNTPDKNLVTHLKSIRKILSQLKDVPGTLKQILNELEATCNSQNMVFKAWSNGPNNSSADEETNLKISKLEATVRELMEMSRESTKLKSKQHSNTKSVNNQQRQSYQTRLMGEMSLQAPPPHNVVPAKPDVRNNVTQSDAETAAQTVAKSGKSAQPAPTAVTQSVKSAEANQPTTRNPKLQAKLNALKQEKPKHPDFDIDNSDSSDSSDSDSDSEIVFANNNGPSRKPKSRKKLPTQPENSDSSGSDSESESGTDSGSSDDSVSGIPEPGKGSKYEEGSNKINDLRKPPYGGRRLKKDILKRFKSLKTKTTKMTKKTKPTKTTKMTKKTRKNKTQTLRHTQRRRQQHQHIRRRTYKKKPNPKPKRNPKRNPNRNPKRNRKVNVNVKH
jgi:hypothetical protein